MDELKRALARRRVGRYEVLDRLGRGGTGVVWRACDVRLGRVVALKLLSRPRAPDDLVTTYHARFQREARVAVTLNHVNIVRGLDYGESDGYVYFAMEFVSGESAGERLDREGRLPEADALRIALQVVDALLYVREFGLVHRDIKPANLLLTPTGDVKVCDLGLAKPTAREAARLHGEGLIAGTPLYMAPEQVRDPGGVDWRTDVYGLGATLYHLLTGRPPFVPSTSRSVIQSLLSELPSDPREHVLALSAGTAAVVMKMLAKDPGDRYASIEALAADLAAALEGRPPTHALHLRSGHDSPVAGMLAEAQGVRARLTAPQRRRRAAALAGLALLAAGAAAWTLWPSVEPLPRRAAGTRDVARSAGSRAAVAQPGPVVETTTRTVVPTVPRADPGRAALALARAMDGERVSLDDVIRQFEHVAERFTAHPSGEAAAARLSELRIELEGRAAAELTRRRRAAAAARERGAVSVAADELQAFPVLYHGTDAYAVALEEAARLVREGRARAQGQLDDARLAAVEWRFDAARALVEEARTTGLADLPIRQVELEIGLEQSARDAERSARRPRWRIVAGRALMVSLTDPVAAEQDLSAELENGALRTYEAEIDALRAWLPRAHRARVRLEAAWSAWAAAGRLVDVRTVGSRERTVSGVPVAVRSGRLALAASGDAAVEVRAAELPLDLLAEAISPGATRASLELDDVAAFLLATRRLADAATFQAPPDLIDVVRAAAIAEADARLDRAAVFAAERDVAEARTTIEDAIAYAPWYAPSFTALGRLLAATPGTGDAEAAFRRALEVRPPDTAARVHLAAEFERRSDFASAEGHLRLFLAETEASEDERLVALRDRASQALERVVERRVEDMLGTLRRDARGALRAGRRGTASGLFARILTARPDDAEALLELGRLHRDAGRIFDAYRAWTRLTRAHPGDRRVAEAERAIAGLEHFRSGAPAGREALRAARRAADDGRADDAIKSFRNAIRLSPFLVDAHAGLAKALLTRGRDGEFREDLTAAAAAGADALLLAPELAAALLVRAEALLLLRDVEPALAAAERAAERLSDASPALVVAGRCLLAAGRLDEALTRFEDAFTARQFADPLYWQAVVLDRQGRRRVARLKLELLYDEWGAPPHLERDCALLYQRLAD